MRKSIKGIDINVTDAVKKYHSALDLYCQKKGCKVPVPDKPKPGPATNQYTTTQHYGGGGGSPFTFQINSTTMNAIKFLVRHGSNIDKLQI